MTSTLTPLASAPVSNKLGNVQEDYTPIWKLTLLKVVEVAIILLVSIGFIVLAEALLPISFKAIVLPIIGMSSVFTCAFMFIPKHNSPQIAPAPQESQKNLSPTRAAPSEPIPVEAPRGIANRGGNDCWANSLAQLLRTDQATMDWYKGLPRPIQRFPYAAGLIPREIFFSLDVLANHPITTNPSNPTLTTSPLPSNYHFLSAEQKERYRQRINDEIFNWAILAPELALIPIEEIFSSIPVSDLLPIEVFSHFPVSEQNTRRKNAIQLVKSLRQTEVDKQIQQKSLLNSIRPQPLPANFASLKDEQRAEFRQSSDAKIIRWMSSFKESDMILIDVATIFSDTPISSILDALAWEGQAPSEQVFHRENATILITKLRQITLEEQMTLEEKEMLLGKFEGYSDHLDVTTAAQKQQLIDRLTTYRSALNILLFFKRNLISDLSVDELQSPDQSFIRDEWFNHLPVNEQELAKIKMRAEIQAIRQDRTILSLFSEGIGFLQELLELPAASRENLLCYLTIVHGTNNRLSSLQFFKTHHDFFAAYEAAKQGNQNSIATLANSEKLRAAFRQSFPDFIHQPNIQCDPAEAFGLMAAFLPPWLKVGLTSRRVYQTDGLPKIADSPDGVRSITEKNHGFLQLNLTSESSNLAEMLRNYFDSERSDSEKVRLKGEDGRYHEYSLKREQHQFENAPQNLWLPIIRFCFQAPPKNFFQTLLPCLFSAPEKQPMKLETDVILPETLTITTVAEGNVDYKLDGFIVHIGSGVNSGHYISYKLERNEAGEEVWYEMNDSQVKKIDDSYLARQKKQAYVPHYSRI